MNEETHQKLMQIKRSFRLLMNGPTSQSMSQKGIGYKINWGVPFIELKKMASEYGKDYSLAIELWKEDIRECKILATLIMPAEEMLPEITEIWMEQVKTQEMAEMLAFNLLQYVNYALLSPTNGWHRSSLSIRLPVSNFSPAFLPMDRRPMSVASMNFSTKRALHCKVTTWV